jgi:hypothetical protein
LSNDRVGDGDEALQQRYLDLLRRRRLRAASPLRPAPRASSAPRARSLPRASATTTARASLSAPRNGNRLPCGGVTAAAISSSAASEAVLVGGVLGAALAAEIDAQAQHLDRLRSVREELQLIAELKAALAGITTAHRKSRSRSPQGSVDTRPITGGVAHAMAAHAVARAVAAVPARRQQWQQQQQQQQQHQQQQQDSKLPEPTARGFFARAKSGGCVLSGSDDEGECTAHAPTRASNNPPKSLNSCVSCHGPVCCAIS